MRMRRHQQQHGSKRGRRGKQRGRKKNARRKNKHQRQRSGRVGISYGGRRTPATSSCNNDLNRAGGNAAWGAAAAGARYASASRRSNDERGRQAALLGGAARQPATWKRATWQRQSSYERRCACNGGACNQLALTGGVNRRAGARIARARAYKQRAGKHACAARYLGQHCFQARQRAQARRFGCRRATTLAGKAAW